MTHGKKRSKVAAALPWVVVVLMLCWISFEAVPREIRAEHDLVPSSERFDYESWHTDLHLSRSSNGIAVLTVTETIVADFPESDENTGIIREIPVSSPRFLHDFEVRDGNDSIAPFSTEFDEDDQVVRVFTGNDEYVYGEETYIIEYTVDQGLFRRMGSGMQEFYWNLLPRDSTQSVGEFSAALRVDPALAYAMTGHSTCEQGRDRNWKPCDLETAVQEDGTLVYETSSGYRPPGDMVAMGVGFEIGTFNYLRSPRWEEPSHTYLFFERYGTASMAFAVLILAIALSLALFRASSQRVTNSNPYRSTEPTPVDQVPASIPPPVAAALMGKTKDRTLTPKDNIGNAQIVHTAVQGAVQFENLPSSDGRDDVGVRLSDPDLVEHELDDRTVHLLCPGLKPDSVHELPKRSHSYSTQLTSIVTDGEKSAAEQNLLARASRERGPAALGVLSIVIALAGFALLSNWLRSEASSPAEGFTVLGGAIALIVTFVFSFRSIRPPRQPTEQGWSVIHQLKGIRSYLQKSSEQGSHVSTAPSGQGTESHDKLLPYAMLMGMGNDWEQVLNRDYEASGSLPAWLNLSGRDFAHQWSQLNSRLRQATIDTSAPNPGEVRNNDDSRGNDKE